MKYHGHLIFLCLATLSFSISSLSFTLVNTGRGFDDNKIDIHIAGTDCSAAGFTTSKYKELIENAVEYYWNNVPTSSIELNVKDVDSSIDIAADTHFTALTKVPANSILAGCNGNESNGFKDGGVLGSAVMSCSGSTCKAILILNAHANSYLKFYSESEVEAVIAHEIGHAFGLGHSQHRFNLMFYSADDKTQKWLGMDDINGVSYLYPHEPAAALLGIPLLGNCGTLTLDNDNNTSQFISSSLFGLFSFIFLFFLNFLFKYIRRSQKI